MSYRKGLKPECLTLSEVPCCDYEIEEESKVR